MLKENEIVVNGLYQNVHTGKIVRVKEIMRGSKNEKIFDTTHSRYNSVDFLSSYKNPPERNSGITKIQKDLYFRMKDGVSYTAESLKCSVASLEKLRQLELLTKIESEGSSVFPREKINFMKR